MTEMSTEEVRTPPKLSKRVAKALLAFLVSSPIAGGVIGYNIGETSERGFNRADLIKAERYERCLAVVAKNTQPGSDTAVVFLSQLSRQESIDCGLQVASTPTKDDIKRIEYWLPLDAKVVQQEVETTLQLPSPTSLHEAIAKSRADAADFNDRVPLQNALIGTGIGLLSGVVTVAGFLEISDRVQRKQHDVESPAPVT